MKEFFRNFAGKTALIVGSAPAFTIAIAVIVAWAITGPFFGFSNTWQLIINTGTTIVTFLMVFLIQNTQNRDMTAMQLKLDELIRALKGARTGLVDIEDLSEKDLDKLKQYFAKLSGGADAVKEEIEQQMETRSEKKDKQS